MSDEPKMYVRVLVYRGPAEWLENTLKYNAIKGKMEFPNGATIEEMLPLPGPQTVLFTGRGIV